MFRKPYTLLVVVNLWARCLTYAPRPALCGSAKDRLERRALGPGQRVDVTQPRHDDFYVQPGELALAASFSFAFGLPCAGGGLVGILVPGKLLRRGIEAP
jgi:hypothetical protein